MGSNVLITGKYVGDRTEVKEVRVDASNELIIISHEHSKVHEGRLFGVGYYNAALANNANLDVRIVTPATHTAHVYIRTAGGGDHSFRAYEGTTYTAAGTALTPVNHNRTSSNTANASTYHTPTVDALGTLLWEEYVPGGTGGASPGAVGQPTAEQVVLAANTDYLFRLTNLSGVTDDFNLIFSFYEVPA